MRASPHRTLAAFGLILTLSAAAQAATIGWNFSDGNAVYDTGTPANFSLTAITIGNTLGTVSIPVTNASTSNYGGASGTYNIGNAVKIGALDTSTSSYYEITFTPDPSYTLTISDFDFGARSTSTGPQAYALRTSQDAYATNIFTGSIANNSVWVLKDNTFSAITASGPITLRLYTYGGTGSPTNNAINNRLDDISITVTATPVAPVVPVPASAAGGVALLALSAVAHRLRRA